MQFRKNINALRAIAVICVVLFHFKVSGFKGGFAGVDIFFVISGFLMTGIIANGLQNQNFSLLGFYASRARRIVPALLVLCLALLLFGFVYLPLDDYRELIRTLKSSLLFGSNIEFAKTGNYFAAPLHENWLLHTWSLSVEWQFYMLYPLLLMGLNNYLGLNKTKLALLGLTLVSLAASVYLSQTRPVFAFYMLPTRAWEMMVGGLVFLFPLQLGKRVGHLAEVLGLAAIAFSVLCFSEQDAWPGYLALVPVLGTAMVILANTESAFSRNGVLQFSGRISYSVYLWHWPLVVFLYTCGLLNSWPSVVAAVLLSFVLGALSYYRVESRVGKITTAPRTLFKYAIFVMLAIGMSAITSSVVKDHPGVRVAYVDLGRPDYTTQLFEKECYPSAFGAAECKLGKGVISVILFGDSHAEANAAAVQLDNPHAALSWARGGCPTLAQFEMRDKEQLSKCLGFNTEKLGRLKTAYSGIPVVLLSRASLYSDTSRDNSYRVYFSGQQHLEGRAFDEAYTAEYTKTVCSIAENHPVYIVKPIPEMPFSVYKGLNLHKRIFNHSSDITASLQDYQHRNSTAIHAIEHAAQHCNATVIDPTPYLCPNGQCMGSKDGVPLYYDDNHLVDSGNKALKGLFKEVFEPL